MYYNTNIILATKHKKEMAIKQPFKTAFSANIITPNNFDTDQFGTFSGEIQRTETAYMTSIKKAKLAMETFGYDFGISSEGSFGPHPNYFFVPADIELMTFIDSKRNLIITEVETTTDTNYAHIDISEGDSYDNFLLKSQFGNHGLIVISPEQNVIIAKGIQKLPELKDILKSAFKNYATLRLQTDMRAHMNPTRMNIIASLTHKLIHRLSQHCPGCDSPGFGKRSVQGHLNCEVCGTETELYRHTKFECVKCDYSILAERKDGLIQSSAQHCPLCNP